MPRVIGPSNIRLRVPTHTHTHIHVPTYTCPFMCGRIELHPDGGREGVDCERSRARGGGRSKKHVNSRYGCRAATRLLSRRNIYRASLGICMQTRDRVPSFRHPRFPRDAKLTTILFPDAALRLLGYLVFLPLSSSSRSQNLTFFLRYRYRTG